MYGQETITDLTIDAKNVTEKLAKQENLETLTGAYVAAVRRDGAADRAGIKPGDVVIKVNDKEVNDVAELQTTINSHDPGDEVTVTVIRSGKEIQFDVTLRNRQGTTELVTGKKVLNELGAEFKPIDESEKQRTGVSYGVQIVNLEDGKLSKSGVREGFIILSINGQKIKSINDIQSIYNQVSDGTRLEFEGLYPGSDYIYVYQIEK